MPWSFNEDQVGCSVSYFGINQGVSTCSRGIGLPTQVFLQLGHFVVL